MIEKVREILAKARRDGRSALLEHEVYEILAAAGLDVPRFAFWAGEPGAAVPAAVARLLAEAHGEVVLKIVSPEILHKSDVGGVAVAPGEAGGGRRRRPEDLGRRRPPDAGRASVPESSSSRR